MSKKYITDNIKIDGQLLDSSGDAGTSNQVLVSTATGINWVDGSGSGIIGGPYLPLAGGTMTGTLNTQLIAPTANVTYNLGSSTNHWLEAFMYSVRSGGVLQFKTNGDNERMRIDSSGNVGIGETNPGQKLHISNGGIRVEKFATGLGGFISVGNATEVAGNYSAYFFGNTSNDTGYFKGGIAYETLSSTYGRGDMHFLQKSDTGIGNADISHSVMTILNGGNVGIGTTSPSDKLHITGGNNFNGLRIEGTSPGIYLIDTEATSAHHISSNGDALYFLRDTDQNGSYNTIMAYWKSNDDFIFNLGNVGIGASNPASKLEVNGDIRLKNSGRLYLWKDNSSNYIDYNNWITSTGATQTIQNTGSGGITFKTSTSARMFINSSGNVGIGTTSPNHKLDIYSNENVPLRIHRPSNANLDSSGAWGIGFSTRSDSNTSTTDTRAGIFSYYNGNLFLAANNTSIVSDPDAYARLTILSTGNVGIGTTSPSKKLEVVSNTTYDGIQISGSSIPTLGIVDTTNNAKFVAYVRDSDATIGMETNHPLTINTNNTERIRVTNAGNVGIGTTTPTVKLHVASSETGYASTLATTVSLASLLLKTHATDSTVTSFGGISSGGGYIQRSNGAGTTPYNILLNPYGGNVGIGTPTPSSIGTGITTLDIEGSNAGGVAFGVSGTKNYIYGASTMYVQANTTAAFLTSGTEKMRVTSGGNVGIGETNPDTILHIKDGGTGLKIEDSSGTDTYAQIRFAGGDLDIYSRNGSSYGDIQWWRYDGVGAQQMMRLNGSTDRSLRLYAYGSGNITGTATKMLGVTSAGIVVEEALPKRLDRCSFQPSFKSPTAQTNYLVWVNGSYQSTTGPEIYKTALYNGSIDIVKVISDVTVSGVYIDVYETGAPTTPIWSSGSTSLTANTVTSFSPSGATFSANDQLYVTLAIPTSATIIYRIDFGLSYD